MIRSSFAVAIGATLAAGLSAAAPAFSQEETDQRFGTVHFATSCNETAQRRFDRGMRYQHSFWYQSSREIFEDVLKADPECGIAHWGIALSLLYNPHAPPPAPNLPLGLAAIQKGKAVGAKSQRERDYIDALSVMYVDYDKIPHRERVQAYLKAMEALAGRYPDDDEAQIFYAITLNVAASPNDKTYANQLKGAAILEPIFKRQPRHPGVAHYLIHLYDTPALADKGLEAAKRYSAIAPAAPARATHAVAHLHARRLLEGFDHVQHGVRARGQGQQGGSTTNCTPWTTWSMRICSWVRTKRRKVSSLRCKRSPEPVRIGSAARTHSPSVRRDTRWNAATGRVRRNCQARPSKFAYADAMTHFARALGAARMGNPDAGQGRHRQVGRTAREVARGQGRLLDRTGRHPMAGRIGLGALCRGQVRRGAQSHERRG